MIVGETTMAHTRIRKFNTKDTYPEQRLDNDLCQAVVTRGGRTVYLRGQVAQPKVLRRRRVFDRA